MYIYVTERAILDMQMSLQRLLATLHSNTQATNWQLLNVVYTYFARPSTSL